MGRNIWRIDYNALDCEVVNIKGPGFKEDVELKVKFHLRDDDDGIYYYGRMEDYDFQPLYDYGLPNAGCTSLWYEDPNEYGNWVML